MTRKSYPWPIALTTVVVGILAACGGRTETPSPTVAIPSPVAETPSPTVAASPSVADGATLLQERCTVCHTLERVESAHKTAGEWERTVARMIGRGAKLTEAERAILVEYLAAHYR